MLDIFLFVRLFVRSFAASPLGHLGSAQFDSMPLEAE